MPRQGVPYPSEQICSLKERIAELEDKIELLMKSINGVTGDAAQDHSLTADHPGVVIRNDQAQHEIGIGLDTSELPAAAVTSVNGATGAVVLDAGDIGTAGGSDVETELAVLASADGSLGGAIASEAGTRAAADATLQSNINAVSAGLPAAAAAAVAADPTVTQLATDVPNKLDKITSGSSLKAYTHTGATQGETSVVDGTTANSIGIRDANGRMQAADPASGATNKTLVTANWVSQTGDSAPNNLIHKTGNETKNGNLQLNNQFNRGCTVIDMVTDIVSPIGTTVLNMIDQSNANTHNQIGSITRVKNTSQQNYIDINNISYGYVDSDNIQYRIDLFIRLLIDDTTGNSSLVLYRQKRNADGSGTVSTTARIIQSIQFSE